MPTAFPLYFFLASISFAHNFIMSKEYKTWDSKGAAAKRLIELFDLYKSTNGAAGINYHISTPKDILNDIYKQHDFLKSYNPQYFLQNHFRNLRNNWLTATAKKEGRKKNKGEGIKSSGESFFILFLFQTFIFLIF